MDGPASSEHLVEITATNVPRFALAAVSTDVVSLWAASIAVLRVATVKALRK